MSEKIIIDGVDVSGCEYACNTAFGKNGCKHPMMKNIYCSKNPNCYFKQLARKTQECESLKQEIEILQNNFDTATRDCNDEIEILKQECEELKKQLEFVRTHRTVVDAEKNSYRKALENIEKIIKEYDCVNCSEQHCEDCNKGEIFYIINKAKGEEC